MSQRKVFISYRREDSAGYARSLFDRLNGRFPGRIFMDVTTIDIGADFARIILQNVSSCNVIIALIGRTWCTCTTEPGGGRRIEDPNDYVRLEIASALSRDIVVIPALVGGASLPSPEELPDDLHPLRQRNSIVITDTSFDTDVNRLIEAIDRELHSSELAELITEADTAIAKENWEGAIQPLEAAKRLSGDRIEVEQKLFWVKQKRRKRASRRLWIGGMPLVIAALIIIIFWGRTGHSDVDLKNHLSSWVQRIFSTQSDNGGFRLDLTDVSSRTQAFTTAQCLKAILSAGGLSSDEDRRLYRPQVQKAFKYLESVRSQDKGWALFEDHKWSLTEGAAWSSVAMIAALDSASVWDQTAEPEVRDRIQGDLDRLVQRQAPSGGWGPIANVRADYTRTYSTIMALWSLIEAERSPSLQKQIRSRYDAPIRNGITWLQTKYNHPVGWVPNPNREKQSAKFPGLTAQTLFVLARAAPSIQYLRDAEWYKQAKVDFLKNREVFASPLNRNAQIPDGDVNFPGVDYVAEATTFLWYPWSVAVCKVLSSDQSISAEVQKDAARSLRVLYSRRDALLRELESGGTYVLAENLIGFSYDNK